MIRTGQYIEFVQYIDILYKLYGMRQYILAHLKKSVKQSERLRGKCIIQFVLNMRHALYLGL